MPASLRATEVCLDRQLAHDHANRTFTAYFIRPNQQPCVSKRASERVGGSGKVSNVWISEIINYGTISLVRHTIY